MFLLAFDSIFSNLHFCFLGENQQLLHPKCYNSLANKVLKENKKVGSCTLLFGKTICLYISYLYLTIYRPTCNNTVVDSSSKPNRTCSNGMPCARTGLFIREPTDATNLSYSSSDDEVTNQSATVIFPTYTGMLTSIDGLERGESSKGKSIRRNCVHK